VFLLTIEASFSLKKTELGAAMFHSLRHATLFVALVAALLNVGLATRAAFALDPGADVDKGTSPSDWANGVLKGNSDKWDVPGHVPIVDINVPYVGLSVGMFDILRHVHDDVLADLEQPKNFCKAAAISKAWVKLGDAIVGGAGLAAGKTIVDTLKSIAGLLELPEAEIANQIAGKASESLRDAIKDKLKDLYKGQKPEVYYSTSVVDECDVIVLAVWDKANGTFEVIIYGDCHCKSQSVFMSLQKASLRTFSIKLSGTVVPQLVGNTITLRFHDNAPDIHANCSICIGNPSMTANSPPPDPPGTARVTQTPKPPPRDVKTKCIECQPIVDRIVAIYKQLDVLDIQIRQEKGFYDGLISNKSTDTAAISDAAATVARLGQQELSLKHELIDLAGKLVECERDYCGTGRVVVLPGPPSGPPPSTAPGTPVPPVCQPCQDLRSQIAKIDQRMEQANKELESAQKIEQQGGNSQRVEDARNRVIALNKELGTLQNKLDELNILLAKCEKGCIDTQTPPQTPPPQTPQPSTVPSAPGASETKTPPKAVPKGNTVKPPPKTPKKAGKSPVNSGQTDTGTSDALSRGLSIGIGIGLGTLGGRSHGGDRDDRR
jgi:hypothetical protein